MEMSKKDAEKKLRKMLKNLDTEKFLEKVNVAVQPHIEAYEKARARSMARARRDPTIFRG